MNIDKQIDKISGLIDELDTNSLTEDEANEFLMLSEEIVSNIEKAEDLPQILERFKSVGERLQTNALTAKIMEHLEHTVGVKEKESVDLKKGHSLFSAPSPFDNN